MFLVGEITKKLPVTMFERSVIAGAVNVVNLDGKDPLSFYPPSRVTDLSVNRIERKWIIQISWTASGSHLDTGRGNYLFIRKRKKGIINMIEIVNY